MRIAGYEFTEGARFQPGEHPAAKEVGEHLEMLRQRFKGEITPRDLLDDARNPNSPLHSFFEWSDTEAAEQYRLQQARGLIRSVVAIYVQEDKPATRVRAYVHVPEPGTPHYRETGHAMSQKKTRDMVLQRALRELIGWQKRYHELHEFADLFENIEQLELKLSQEAKH